MRHFMRVNLYSSPGLWLDLCIFYKVLNEMNGKWMNFFILIVRLLVIFFSFFFFFKLKSTHRDCNCSSIQFTKGSSVHNSLSTNFRFVFLKWSVPNITTMTKLSIICLSFFFSSIVTKKLLVIASKSRDACILLRKMLKSRNASF